jgi:hypothetical protein
MGKVWEKSCKMPCLVHFTVKRRRTKQTRRWRVQKIGGEEYQGRGGGGQKKMEPMGDGAISRIPGMDFVLTVMFPPQSLIYANLVMKLL